MATAVKFRRAINPTVYAVGKLHPSLRVFSFALLCWVTPTHARNAAWAKKSAKPLSWLHHVLCRSEEDE